MKDILIVVDMQNDFINGSLGTKEAEAILPGVIEKVKNHQGPVLYTKDTHQKDYLNTQEGEKLPVEHCIENTPGWELTGELDHMAKEGDNLVFRKDTFGSKGLVKYLVELNEEEKISSIELVGLCTDICVISNALMIKAFLPEIPLKVDASCCAGVTAESHENALKAMEVCQVEIIN